VLLDGDDRVREFGGGLPKGTNNQMELLAVIQGLREILQRKQQNFRIIIATDSSYVIQGATKWHIAWKKNGWVTKEGNPVLNQNLWKDMSSLLESFKKTKATLSWVHTPGHSGVPGNERVDTIASAFAAGEIPRLFSDGLEKYDLSRNQLMNFNPPAGAKIQQKTKKKKGKAYSYLSLVGGKVERHQSWGECENRVSGQSGAKFQKAVSLEDENEILQSWGVSLIHSGGSYSPHY
jgi:ribonuclease HI